MGMEGAALQNSKEPSQPSGEMEGAVAVVEGMEGAGLRSPCLEVMEGAGPQLLLAHQILIALQHRFQTALAPKKRKGMEGVDLHDQCLEGMAGAGSLLVLANQCSAHRQNLAMEMEGDDLHKQPRFPLLAMEGVDAVRQVQQQYSYRWSNFQRRQGQSMLRSACE